MAVVSHHADARARGRGGRRGGCGRHHRPRPYGPPAAAVDGCAAERARVDEDGRGHEVRAGSRPCQGGWQGGGAEVLLLALREGRRARDQPLLHPMALDHRACTWRCPGQDPWFAHATPRFFYGKAGMAPTQCVALLLLVYLVHVGGALTAVAVTPPGQPLPFGSNLGMRPHCPPIAQMASFCSLLFHLHRLRPLRRHYHAHAAIVLRDPNRFADNRDVLHFLVRAGAPACAAHHECKWLQTSARVCLTMCAYGSCVCLCVCV